MNPPVIRTQLHIFDCNALYCSFLYKIIIIIMKNHTTSQKTILC